MIVVTCSNPPENPPEKNVNRTLVAPRRQRHAPSSVSQRCSCSSTARRRRRACRALKGLWPVAEGKFTPSLDGETMKPAETLFFSGTFCFFVWEIYQPTAWFDLQTRGFYRDNNNILSSFFQQIVRVCVLTIFSKQKILVGILSATLDSTKLRGALHAIKMHRHMGAGLKQLEATTTRVTWCWNVLSNHKKTCRPASNVPQHLTLGLQYSFQTNPNPFFKEIDPYLAKSQFSIIFHGYIKLHPN